MQFQPFIGIISRLTGSYHALKIGLSDTAVMDMMISNLQQQRQVTEQLRREAAIKRISVSQAVQDIIKFITEHEQEDCLLWLTHSEKRIAVRYCEVFEHENFALFSVANLWMTGLSRGPILQK